jgi:membrane protein YqaA with SNARE-associated domain
MDIIPAFMDFLSSVQHDPVTYSIFLFLYSGLAAIILPIPVEAALFISPDTPFALKAVIMGAGKALGSIAVFYIGFNLEGPVRNLSKKWKFFDLVVRFSEWFVSKLGYVGMYLLLSVPLMADTVILYIFSLFNKEGKELELKKFALVNFLAGITRAAIVYLVMTELGWDIV